MSRSVLAALVLSFATGIALLAQTAMPSGLRDARNAFEAATGKGDKAVLQRLLVDDFTWVDRAGRLRDKKTVLQELRGGRQGSTLSSEARVYPGGARAEWSASSNHCPRSRGREVVARWNNQHARGQFVAAAA